MRMTRNPVCAVLMGIFIGAAGPVQAAPFSFSTESFGITGNLSSNPVDEFDDGVIAPWTTEGTVSEAGGRVTLQNPGLVITGERNGVAIVQQTSRIRLQAGPGDAFYVEDGAGDFSGTSRWVPTLPAQNQSYGVVLTRSEIAGPADEDFILNIFGGADAALAQFFGLPATPPGFVGVGFTRTINNDPGSAVSQFAVIDPADIVGDILLRLTYLDVGDLVGAEFSLDGGATFQAPFSAIGSGIGPDSGFSWDVYVDDFEARFVPEPASLAILVLGVAVLGLARRRNAA